MRALTPAQTAALALPGICMRIFIWFPDDAVGFWNDVGDRTYGGRLYHGSGPVISISSLSAKGDMTIPGMRVTLSGLDPQSIALVRGTDFAQTPVEIMIGIFDPNSQALIDDLFQHFTGVVDDTPINTPPAGGSSTIVIICESTSRALTMARTSTRSHASCIERSPDDSFYDDTGSQKDKPLYFGRADVTAAASSGGGTPGMKESAR